MSRLTPEPAVGIEPTTARLGSLAESGKSALFRSLRDAPDADKGRSDARDRARTANERPTARLHPAYSCWRNMRQRCLNPAHQDFARYGGRGITIDPRWGDFATFAADMGERPAGHTLERIDNDRGYEPGNVRWASRWEQGQNRAHTPMIAHDGRRQSLSAWVRELGNPLGISESTIHARVVRLKWPIMRALEQPAQIGRNRFTRQEAA